MFYSSFAPPTTNASGLQIPTGYPERCSNIGNIPGRTIRAGVTQQQRTGMDKSSGVGLSAACYCLKLFAFRSSERPIRGVSGNGPGSSCSRHHGAGRASWCRRQTGPEGWPPGRRDGVTEPAWRSCSSGARRGRGPFR